MKHKDIKLNRIKTKVNKNGDLVYTKECHSIMKVPIKNVKYKVKDRTTICRITWINPCNGNTQLTIGVATCNPDDEFNAIIGTRLSESRAKINMYSTFIDELQHIADNSCVKHYSLIYAERKHQDKIKPTNK